MSRILAYFHAHRKAVVAWAGTLLTLLLVAVPHNSTWYAVVVAAATAAGVHVTGNRQNASKP